MIVKVLVLWGAAQLIVGPLVGRWLRRRNQMMEKGTDA